MPFLAIALGAQELNPILKLFGSNLGDAGMLFVKSLFAIALGGILWERRKQRLLVGMNMLMIGVVIYKLLAITYFL